MHSAKRRNGIATFFSYYKPYRALFFADMFCSAATAALALVFPLLVRQVTQTVLGDGAGIVTSTLITMGGVMIALILLQTACALFYDYKGHDMGARIERDMRVTLFSHLETLSFSFFDGQKTGQLMSRLTHDLIDLSELFHHGPEDLLVYGLEFIGSLVILFALSPRLTLVVCAFLPVMLLYTLYFSKRLKHAFQTSRAAIAEVNAQAEDSLSGIRVAQSFTNEALETEKFARRNTLFYKSRVNIYKNEAFHYTVMDMFFKQSVTIAVIVFGGLWIAGGVITIADLLAFLLYVGYLTAPIPRLTHVVAQYQDGLAGYRRFREILETEPEIKDAPGAVPLDVPHGKVEFDRVSFRYDGTQPEVLRGVSLTVEAGETVAIVGTSGVGKTTLCSLLPRFYDVTEGEIRIDGTPIRDATLSSLRGKIGVVQQDAFLFSGTVVENIRYGKPNATMAEIREAAKKANAHVFIEGLPNGYDTEIGERGVKLSGGQRQRLSVARAFLKDPPILILDEATSALDNESERAVLDSLRALAKGRTALVIAHRLSTIQNADRIIVLSEDGGCAEQGTHDALMARGGVYARLYAMETGNAG